MQRASLLQTHYSYFSQQIYFLFRKRATEHLTPPNEQNNKEYEIPYLDDDAYLMQKLWAEKEHAKQRDVFDDKIRRRRRNKDHVRDF